MARQNAHRAKASTARNLWIPAVNNAGAWGRWAVIEISDPWDAKKTIRSLLNAALQAGGG